MDNKPDIIALFFSVALAFILLIVIPVVMGIGIYEAYLFFSSDHAALPLINIIER